MNKFWLIEFGPCNKDGDKLFLKTPYDWDELSVQEILPKTNFGKSKQPIKTVFEIDSGVFFIDINDLK